MKGGRNPVAKALRSYRAQVIGNKKRDVGKYRGVEQSGSSSASYAEGRRFKSCPRNQPKGAAHDHPDRRSAAESPDLENAVGGKDDLEP